MTFLGQEFVGHQGFVGCSGTIFFGLPGFAVYSVLLLVSRDGDLYQWAWVDDSSEIKKISLELEGDERVVHVCIWFYFTLLRDWYQVVVETVMFDEGRCYLNSINSNFRT